VTFKLEKWFWDTIHTVESRARERSLLTPRDVIAAMMSRGYIISEKQAWATLTKWSGKGWYDYGVTLDLGWKVDDRPFPRVPQNPPWHARPGRLLAPEDA